MIGHPSPAAEPGRGGFPVRRIPFYFLVQTCIWVGVLIHGPAFAETYLESFLRSTSITPNREIRAAWVVRNSLDSKSDVDRAVDYAIRARFQLLFVQVRGRADAYYRSSLEPEGLSLKQPVAQFDPLDYFLTRCREAGISVHAWVNVFLVWSDGRRAPPAGHIAAEHPEWLVTNVSGVRMDERPLDEWLAEGQTGYFVSPSRADVREHTTRVIQEIASRYRLDGVHLDYIRYPGPQFDFGPAERTAFTLRYGIDPAWFAGSGRWDRRTPIVGSSRSPASPKFSIVFASSGGPPRWSRLSYVSAARSDLCRFPRRLFRSRKGRARERARTGSGGFRRVLSTSWCQWPTRRNLASSCSSSRSSAG